MSMGKQPAFPTKPIKTVVGQMSYTFLDAQGIQQVGYQNEFGEIEQPGMDIRTYLAGLAMQGLIAASIPDLQGNNTLPVASSIAAYAVECADELLKQLEP